LKTIKLMGLSALFVCVAAPAMAQSDSGEGTVFGYNLNVSVRARVQPSYEGSNDYKLSPSGSISFSRPGEARIFSAPDDGISVSIGGNKTIDGGVTGRFLSGRDNDDDLRGMQKIDLAVEVGGFVNFWPTEWLRTRLSVRRGFGGHEGVVADLGADFVSEQGRWTLAAGPRVSYSDDEYNQTYFGVTPREAIASPLIAAAYTADGGIRYAGVQASADYQWSPRWRFSAEGSYRRLMGDAADSPIVRQFGSEDQFGASIGVRYAFGS